MGKIVAAIQSQVPNDFEPWGFGAEALFESALMLGEVLEDSETSPNGRAFCQKELRETLDRLRDLAPSKAERDAIDELSQRRAERLATVG